ncbi:MAG TPA: Crp/Fnr family transcriptional regulator [Terriglobales bacterium]|nr:Crp/Fnr family transcriptional regulator [Terriglobales bacterium]
MLNESLSPLEANSGLLQELQKRSTPLPKTKGSVLFYQGQRADGIYLISTGQAQLSFVSAQGKVLGSRVAGPNTVLGLPAIISNQPHSLKAEIIEDSTIAYVSREQLVDLMRSSTALAIKVIELLGWEVRQTREMLANASRPGMPGLQVAR